MVEASTAPAGQLSQIQLGSSILLVFGNRKPWKRIRKYNECVFCYSGCLFFNNPDLVALSALPPVHFGPHFHWVLAPGASALEVPILLQLGSPERIAHVEVNVIDAKLATCNCRKETSSAKIKIRCSLFINQLIHSF